MTDHQERRRKQVNAIRVKASPQRMSSEEFKRQYKEPHVIFNADMRDEEEKQRQEMFCDECLVPMQHNGIKAYLLHVTIEDDPLRNFWKLATLRCYGCGFTEIVPLDKPQFTSEELKAFTSPVMHPGAIQSIDGAMGSGLGQFGSRLMGIDIMKGTLAEPWRSEAIHAAQIEESKYRNQIMAQQAHAIQQRNQALQALQQMPDRAAADQHRAANQIMGALDPKSTFEGYSLSNPPKDPTERDSWFKRFGDYLSDYL